MTTLMSFHLCSGPRRCLRKETEQEVYNKWAVLTLTEHRNFLLINGKSENRDVCASGFAQLHVMCVLSVQVEECLTNTKTRRFIKRYISKNKTAYKWSKVLCSLIRVQARLAAASRSTWSASLRTAISGSAPAVHPLPPGRCCGQTPAPPLLSPGCLRDLEAAGWSVWGSSQLSSRYTGGWCCW